MTPSNEQSKSPGDLKQVSVRWDEDFWDRAKRAAHEKRVTLQHAMTVGAAAFLGIEPPSIEPETRQ